jgi:hypothetical protein
VNPLLNSTLRNVFLPCFHLAINPVFPSPYPINPVGWGYDDSASQLFRTSPNDTRFAPMKLGNKHPPDEFAYGLTISPSHGLDFSGD